MNCQNILTSSKARIALVSALAAVLWCVLPPAAPAAAPKSGGTLILGVENEFAGFDALKARGLAICGAIANSSINERLFGMDDHGILIPILGLSAEPSADGLVWTVKLRQGVKFHDETPFTADAVVAHYSRLLDPEMHFRGRAYMQPLISVSKVDEYTVQFKLKRPWPAFLSVLCNPRTLGASIPSPKAVAENRQLQAPVGTGPFMFKEWVTGDRFVVVKNPDYWQAGVPYLDRIIFKPLIDHQTRYASLKAGQANAIWADHGHIIHKAEKDPPLVVHVGEGNGAEILILNTAAPPLDDVRVRRALAHAWNQPMYVKMSYQDTIPVVHHPFGQTDPCENTGYLEHDLNQAKALMDQYGGPVKIEVLHSNARRGHEAGEVAQQLFNPIGVDVTSVGLEFGPVIKRVYARKYQVCTWRIPAMLDFGPQLALAFSSKSPLNVTGYENPEMEALLNAQSVESDPEKRKQLLCDIIRLLNEDAVILYRGGRRFHVIAQPQVKGLDPIRHGIPDLSRVWLDD